MSKVAIIGGGLVGTSVAYRLLQQGAEVTLVDRADVGQATAAGAGILPPLDHFIGVDAVLPLVAAARAYYPELMSALAEEGERDTGYQIVGALHVALDAAERGRLRGVAQACEQRRDSGFGHIGAVTVLDGDGARRLFPLLSHAVLGAVHSAGAARVDGRRLLAALRRSVAQRGGRWLEGSAELLVVGERVTGVRVGAQRVGADAVVVAAGAWSSVLAEQLGVPLGVRPQRGQLIHLELPGAATGAWPIVTGFASSYLLSFPNARVVAGATREDAAGYDGRVTAAGVHGVLDSALRLAPGLAQASVSELRVGFRPLSTDGKPVLGACPGFANLYFATGHGGYGLEVGPYSGALVADLVLGRTPAVDLAPFSVERFGVVGPPGS